MSKETENEKTKVIKSEEMKNAAVPEKGATRVYDIPVKETLIVSKHRWIGDEDEDAAESAGRNTIARGGTAVYGRPDRKTRVGLDSNTRLYEKPRTPSPAEPGPAKEKKDFRAVASDISSRLRGMHDDLRRVRVSDSGRFGRFLKVVGVFGVILLLEIGYFAFAHRTERLPEEIKETRSELELTRKETAILQEEIDELGGYDSIEEQRRSWERLKEKVEKAVAETSF